MEILALLTRATVRPRYVAVTEHFGHEFIGLAVPRPAVVTEMIKEVHELRLACNHENDSGGRGHWRVRAASHDSCPPRRRPDAADTWLRLGAKSSTSHLMIVGGVSHSWRVVIGIDRL